MLKFLIVPNDSKPAAVEFSDRLYDFIYTRGHSAYKMPHGDGELCVGNRESIKLSDIDFAVVLGGDGTVIRSVHQLFGYDIPIMGVNFGSMGYLTEYEPDEAFDCLQKVISGDYTLESRILLDGKLIRNDTVISNFTALNEIVLNRSAVLRPLLIDLHINSAYTAQFSADGILTATPTGSTAYNLSAGGPVMTPSLNGMVITPICSRSTPHCPIVTSSYDCINVILRNCSRELSDDCATLVIDGYESYKVCRDDRITITRSDHRVQFIKTKPFDFYTTLSHKLRTTIS